MTPIILEGRSYDGDTQPHTHAELHEEDVENINFSFTPSYTVQGEHEALLVDCKVEIKIQLTYEDGDEENFFTHHYTNLDDDVATTQKRFCVEWHMIRTMQIKYLAIIPPFIR